MSQKTIQGSKKLGEQLKLRRNELGLTIEEAASRAGVGTKTWCRYEAGESIRTDKCKGICKALNWRSLPEQEMEEEGIIVLDEYRKHEAWSSFLEKMFGPKAALSFALGSDILYDHLKEDLEELSQLPVGSHIGQLAVSWLRDILPEQFLMQYDYAFLYRMKCTLYRMRNQAKAGTSMVAHSVIEELLIYLANQEALGIVEMNGEIDELDDLDDLDLYDEDDTYFYTEEWPFDLFDDMDVVTFLYSNVYLDPGHDYHFSHWYDIQFFMNE